MFYLLNGGSPLKVKYNLLRQVSVKCPSRNMQVVEHSVENIYFLMAEWPISTPHVNLIECDEEIDDFNGNILKLKRKPMLKYDDKINVLFLSF